MHPSEKIQRILNQSLKCSYAQTEVICSLYVHYVTDALATMFVSVTVVVDQLSVQAGKCSEMTPLHSPGGAAPCNAAEARFEVRGTTCCLYNTITIQFISTGNKSACRMPAVVSNNQTQF